MTAGGVCLTMIVRDEAATIARALTAAAPHITCWSIHDTGSTDDTPQLVEALMAEHNIPGRLTRGPFGDFSQARNAGLAHAREVAAEHDADWLLLQDADMEIDGTLSGIGSGRSDALCGVAHAWTMTQRAGDLRYDNIRLLNVHARVGSAARAHYVGPTHEYLHLEPGSLISHHDAAWFIDHADGGTRHEKLTRDLELLAPGHDAGEPRATFYYAQTLRDAGRWADAYAAYQRRASLGGWREEVWYSLWQAAVCAERLGTPAVADYLAAWNADPSRAEPLVDAARLEREAGRWATAELYARAATQTPAPGPAALFVDTATYTWRAWDELAVACWHTGQRREGRAAAAQAAAACPGDQRLADNLAWYAA